MSDKSDASPTRVFVSYARQDAAFEEQLSHELEKYLVSVYRDLEAIRPGESFQASIDEAIEQSSVVLCLVSPAYVNSQWCRRELETAFAHKRPIIPIVVKETPQEKPLSYLNSLDCRNFDKMTEVERDERLALLMKAIKTMGKKNDIKPDEFKTRGRRCTVSSGSTLPGTLREDVDPEAIQRELQALQEKVASLLPSRDSRLEPNSNRRSSQAEVFCHYAL